MRLLPFIAVAFVVGCGSAPKELELATVLAGDAGEALERDVQKLVEAATAEIERFGMLLLDAEVERRWQAEAQGGSISVVKAQEVAAWAAGERQKIMEAAQEKRAQWKASPNLHIMKELLAALRDYHASTGGTIRELEALLGASKETK